MAANRLINKVIWDKKPIIVKALKLVDVCASLSPGN